MSNVKLIACLTTLLFAGNALAQSDAQYPVKPIRMIVPSAPGSGPDIMARAIGQKLSESLGQSIVIDDKPGAGGIIGSETAAKAAPDGYTLIMSNAGSHAVNASLYAKLPYDPVRDFAPVTLVAMAPNILIVHPTLPVHSARELIALAKAKPGELTFGSGGNGSTAHLSGEMFKTMAGINIVHVPFKGSPPAFAALLGGQVDFVFDAIGTMLPHVKSGAIRALAVSTLKRQSSLPDTPAMAEILTGFQANTWYGMVAPGRLPAAMVKRMNEDMNRVMAMPDVIEKFDQYGAEDGGGTPERFAEFIRSETQKWARVIKDAKVQADA